MIEDGAGTCELPSAVCGRRNLHSQRCCAAAAAAVLCFAVLLLSTAAAAVPLSQAAERAIVRTHLMMFVVAVCL